MADVTIDSALDTTAGTRARPTNLVWVSQDVGYVFAVDGGNIVGYWKATAPGTWNGRVTVKASVNSTRNGLWYDRWTEGDSGTLIHFCYDDWNTDLWHWRSLDTSSDTLGTQRTILSADPGTVTNFGSVGVGVVKARGGALYAYKATVNGALFYHSTNGGTSWAVRAAPPWATADNDKAVLLPAYTDDTNDVAAIVADGSANTLDIFVFDASANTWSSATNIAGSISGPDQTTYHNLDAAVRWSDDSAYVVALSEHDTATADLRAWKVTLGSSPSVTALTDVISDTSELASCSILVDQNTGDLYVAYLKGGTLGTAVGVYYKKSTDGGSSWSSETKISEGADANLNALFAGHSANGDGRFQPVWVNDTADDLITNAVNGVALSAGAGSVTGTGAVTLPVSTLAGSGTMTTTGTGAATMPAPTLSGAGTSAVTGTGGATIPGPTLAGSGSAAITGDGAVELASPVLDGSGTVAAAGEGIGAVTIPAPTLAGSGTFEALEITGAGAVVLPAPTLAGSGTSAIVGTGDVVVPGPTSSASGEAVTTGSGGATLPAPMPAGSGTFTVFTITGTAAIVIDAPGLGGTGAFATTGSGGVTIPGPGLSGVETLAAGLATASVQRINAASGAVTLVDSASGAVARAEHASAEVARV